MPWGLAPPPAVASHQEWGGEEAVAPREGVWESQSSCQVQSWLLWSVSLPALHMPIKGTWAWPHPWICRGLGLEEPPSLASFLGMLPSPAHPCPSAHGSSEPVHSHPSSRLPRLGPRGLRRKRSLLRKNSVASVMVGQEVGDSQKCGHCGQRVCGSASKELPGLPRSPSQMLCEGGQGTWRPEEPRLFFPLISPALGHSD